MTFWRVKISEICIQETSRMVGISTEESFLVWCFQDRLILHDSALYASSQHSGIFVQLTGLEFKDGMAHSWLFGRINIHLQLDPSRRFPHSGNFCANALNKRLP